MVMSMPSRSRDLLMQAASSLRRTSATRTVRRVDIPLMSTKLGTDAIPWSKQRGMGGWGEDPLQSVAAVYDHRPFVIRLVSSWGVIDRRYRLQRHRQHS